MATCLVTGGAGFIGSHLARALLARGDRVRVLDNFSTGRRENLAGLAGDWELIEGDIRDRAALEVAVAGVELVFHEAAQVSVPLSMDDPAATVDANETGTVRLLDAARRAGVRCVVLASTCAIYGNSQALPLQEDTPPEPLSPYALSKLVTESYARLYTQSFGLPVVALRYFNVYGPRQRPDSAYAAAIPIFTHRLRQGLPPTIYGDGGQARDFVFVGDVVRANLLAADCPAAHGEVFNVCTGQETTILELVQTLGSLFPGSPPPVFGPSRAGDIYRSLGDPRRAQATLGFLAQTTLADGLRQTVEHAA